MLRIFLRSSSDNFSAFDNLDKLLCQKEVVLIATHLNIKNNTCNSSCICVCFFNKQRTP